MLINDMDGDALKINTDGTANTQLSAASIVLPVQLDSHVSQTIQTHNAVSVALSGTSDGATFLDCNGFDRVCGTMLNGTSGTFSVILLWSNDGVTNHGFETVQNGVTGTLAQWDTGTKARYVKIRLLNSDGAAAHTMSAWAYLKA